MRQMLRGTRYTVTEAASGAEGLERARFDQPHLILLDLEMPDRSGFDVLDELKEDSATRSIPIVIHTSRTLRPEDLARLDVGARQSFPREPKGVSLPWGPSANCLLNPIFFQRREY